MRSLPVSPSEKQALTTSLSLSQNNENSRRYQHSSQLISDQTVAPQVQKQVHEENAPILKKASPAHPTLPGNHSTDGSPASPYPSKILSWGHSPLCLPCTREQLGYRPPHEVTIHYPLDTPNLSYPPKPTPVSCMPIRPSRSVVAGCRLHVSY